MAHVERPIGVEVIQETRVQKALSELRGEQEGGVWNEALSSALEVHGGINSKFVEWAENRLGSERAVDVIEALLDSIVEDDLNTSQSE